MPGAPQRFDIADVNYSPRLRVMLGNGSPRHLAVVTFQATIMSGMVAITRIHAAAVLRAGRLGRLAHLLGEEDRALEQNGLRRSSSSPRQSIRSRLPTLPAEELPDGLHMDRGRREEALAAYRRSLELHRTR
jgi:hypothetical protein